MPKVNHRGIKHCFFLPIGSPHENGMKFELFLVVDEKNCLGFRFETADSEGTHNYNHVQITRQMTLSAKGYPHGYLKAILRSRWAHPNPLTCSCIWRPRCTAIKMVCSR